MLRRRESEWCRDEDVVGISGDVRRDLARRVPGRGEGSTAEGGREGGGQRRRGGAVVPRLRAADREVRRVVDPGAEQLRAAADLGADAVELHTGDFANAPTLAAQTREAERLGRGAALAADLGMKVHAGHGLDYTNYALFARHVPQVEEVSIGFAVIARAVLVGMPEAVRAMRQVITDASAR